MRALLERLRALIKVLPQDKANHGVYGALACGVAIIVAAPVALLGFGRGAVVWVPMGGVLVSIAFGLWKEYRDSQANMAAEAAGQLAPHSVEREDVVATAWGGMLVGLPCLALVLLL